MWQYNMWMPTAFPSRYELYRATFVLETQIKRVNCTGPVRISDKIIELSKQLGARNIIHQYCNIPRSYSRHCDTQLGTNSLSVHEYEYV